MTPLRTIVRRAAVSTRCLRLSAAARSIHHSTTTSSPLRLSSAARPLPAISTSTSTAAHSRRWNSSSPGAEKLEAPDYLSEGELKIWHILKEQLQPLKLEVQDISGGCGSMYGLDIVSEKFKGLTVIKQHRLVNSILGEEIKKWHGVQLKTKAP